LSHFVKKLCKERCKGQIGFLWKNDLLFDFRAPMSNVARNHKIQRNWNSIQGTSWKRKIMNKNTAQNKWDRKQLQLR
jgi:hypothetical protein